MSSHQDAENSSWTEFFDFDEASLEGLPNSSGPGDHAPPSATSNNSWMSTANPLPNQDVASLGMHGGLAPSSNASASSFLSNFTPSNPTTAGPSQLSYTEGVVNLLGGTDLLGNVGPYQFSNPGGQLGMLGGSTIDFSDLPNSLFDADDLFGDVGADLESSSTSLGNTAGLAGVAANADLPEPAVDTISSEYGIGTTPAEPVISTASPEPAIDTTPSKHAINTTPAKPTINTTPAKPTMNTGVSNVKVTPIEHPLESINSNVLSDTVKSANKPLSSSSAGLSNLSGGASSPDALDSHSWEFINSTGSDFNGDASTYSVSSQSADSNHSSTPDAPDSPDESLVDDSEGHSNGNQNVDPIGRQVADTINDQHTEINTHNAQSNQGSRLKHKFSIDDVVAGILADRNNKLSSSSSHAIHISDEDEDEEDDYKPAKAQARGIQSFGHGFDANFNSNPYASGSGTVNRRYGFSGFNNRVLDPTPRPFNDFVKQDADQSGRRWGNTIPGAYGVPQKNRPTQNRQSAKSRRERRSSSPLSRVPSPRSPPRPVKTRPAQAGPTQAGSSRAYSTPVHQAPVHQAPVHLAQSRHLAQQFAPTQSAHYAPVSRSVDPPTHHLQWDPPVQGNRKRKSIDEPNFDTLDLQQPHEEEVQVEFGGPSQLYTPASNYSDSVHTTTTYQAPANSASTHRKKKPAPIPPSYPTQADVVRMSISYQPLYDFVGLPQPPNAPTPVYAAYVGYFATAAEAKQHRKRVRCGPDEKKIKCTPDLQMVKAYGRQYWVRRLYESMIDVSCISDSESSIHRQRFIDGKVFEEKDIEAAAHKVFDEAVAVHERGWNHPKVYYKKVHRGKLQDHCLDSVEKRLALICRCLAESKAAVDDVLRGGITLGLVCDNPMARGGTKQSNNTGNRRRGERLRLIRDATSAAVVQTTAPRISSATPSSSSSQGPSMDKGKGRAVEAQEEDEEFEDDLFDDDDEWLNAQDGGELYGDEVYGMEEYGFGDFGDFGDSNDFGGFE
jgi:hypothetical protein